jgi:hypothetical protein
LGRKRQENQGDMPDYCSSGMDADGRAVLVERAAALLFAEWEEMKQGLELFVSQGA